MQDLLDTDVSSLQAIRVSEHLLFKMLKGIDIRILSFGLTLDS